MSLVRTLENLDRRWIFLMVGLLVFLPLIFPFPLPLTVSPRVRGFYDAIEALPEGSTVLVSCDYDPGARPEMVPMTQTTLRHLFDRHCKVIVTVLWNGGPGIVDATLRSVTEPRGLKYGVDYINLGYKAGYEAVMVLMGQSIPSTFPHDNTGGDTSTYPIMRGIRNYSSFPLLVSLSAGYPGTKEYVQQVQGRFHIKIIAGVTAVSAPEYYPYLQSGQLEGLLGGMAGAAEYEKARGESGAATRGMVPQSMVHLFIAFCILAGNAVQWLKAREAKIVSLHPSHDVGVWVAAALTLCTFSFLYKDNPFYKFAEHLFVGVSAGYYIILNYWTVVVPNLWEPLVRSLHARGGPLHASSGDFRLWLVIPGILGLLLFTRLIARIGWMSRWSLALIIGVYVGLKTTGFAQGDFVAQVQASLQPLWTGHLWTSFNAVLFAVGLISSLLFFFYSREHKGLLGGISKVGIIFLMVSFGAGYGYTVMSRVSLLIGRFQFLLEDWLGYR